MGFFLSFFFSVTHNLKTASHLNWPKWNRSFPCRRLPDLNLPQCLEPENQRNFNVSHTLPGSSAFPPLCPRASLQAAHREKETNVSFLCVHGQACWNAVITEEEDKGQSLSAALSHEHAHPPGASTCPAAAFGKDALTPRPPRSWQRAKTLPWRRWHPRTKAGSLEAGEPKQENPKSGKRSSLCFSTGFFNEAGISLCSAPRNLFMCSLWLPTPPTHTCLCLFTIRTLTCFM